MSKIDLSNVSMSGFDDIFTNNTDEVPAIKVALSELHEFDGHPFRVVDDQLTELVDSIKSKGVLEPGIVRPRKNGGYEIISGHRRRRACELAGLTEMPVRVMDYSDDDATIIMVDSNLHREEILPSEKAKSYAMKFNAMKHQGKEGGKSLEVMSDSLGEGMKTIQRYIWLARLIEGLIELVDKEMIPFTAGVDLSFLNPTYQQLVLQWIESRKINTVTVAQAKEVHLRVNNLGVHFMQADLENIFFSKEAPEKSRLKPFKFKKNRVSEFFPPDTSNEEIEEVIYSLLEKWKNEH